MARHVLRVTPSIHVPSCKVHAPVLSSDDELVDEESSSSSDDEELDDEESSSSSDDEELDDEESSSSSDDEELDDKELDDEESDEESDRASARRIAFTSCTSEWYSESSTVNCSFNCCISSSCASDRTTAGGLVRMRVTALVLLSNSNAMKSNIVAPLYTLANTPDGYTGARTQLSILSHSPRTTHISCARVRTSK